MEKPVTIYPIEEKDKPDHEGLYFYRFIGGNSSETNSLIEQLRDLKEQENILIGLFRFPFRFEGKKRWQTAVQQYFNMKDLCDAVIYFQSDHLMELIDQETTIREAQSTFNEIEEETMASLKQLVNETGEMNIDYHDLENFIRNYKGPLFSHTVEGESFDTPLKYLISKPYLPEDFTDGEQLLINIGYTRDVNMESFRQINLRLHDLFSKADLFKIGSYFINEPGERFRITLIVNGLNDPISIPDDYKLSKYHEIITKCKRSIEKGKRRLNLIKN
ncbi:cell division protein FtsZ [Piscibacillus halophilus]|uniref:cell division protein FtsZ n=1 Tax=Piscibacillus halophilus TaxID=571933 RepID=UPI00158DB6BE|nr:cell division protein FtsZ [Piscibacillus halophilus]